MKQVLWYLIAGTRGGEMRARMIMQVKRRPANANMLAKELAVDYKTVQHHLGILVENNVFSVVNKGNYGATYFISEQMEANYPVFEEIWKQIGKRLL